MIGGLQPILSRLAAATVTAAMTVLSAVRGALAASTSTALPPEYVEIRRLAEEKVRAATQPGAIGNGIPIMNIDLDAMLPWIGVGAAVAVCAVVAAKLLVSMIRGEAVFVH